MPKKKTQLDRFADLTWDDFEEWAGSRIRLAGKKLSASGRVSDWRRQNDGRVDRPGWTVQNVMPRGCSWATTGCRNRFARAPYEFDCKHGVAVAIEYLKQVEKGKSVRRAKPDDDRLQLLDDEDGDDEPDDDDENVLSKDMQKDIDGFLKGKTKAQLTDLIHEIARRYPEIAQDLVDRRHLSEGNTKALVENLRQEIRDIADEPGWQNYWQGEGYTPDYSGIRKKLAAMLAAGQRRRSAGCRPRVGDNRDPPCGSER